MLFHAHQSLSGDDCDLMSVSAAPPCPLAVIRISPETDRSKRATTCIESTVGRTTSTFPFPLPLLLWSSRCRASRTNLRLWIRDLIAQVDERAMGPPATKICLAGWWSVALMSCSLVCVIRAGSTTR
jgi:hypothetical protein